MMTTVTASTQILRRVSTLPPLPAAVGRLLRLVNAPEVEFKEIARTISLDQTLTAQLLRLANSAFYGFPQQIRTVQQATVVLGRHSIRNMVLSLAITRLRKQLRSGGPLDPEEFWRHSIAVAFGARMLAQVQGTVEPDEAFVAGLLHDIGKIVLVEYDPATYTELLGIAGEGIAPLHELEREAFGIDHAEVGKALCDYWNIPSVLASSVAAHHLDDPSDKGARSATVEIVNLADSMAKICRLGCSGNPHVHSTWFSKSRTFCEMPGRVREMVDALPTEVAGNEEIFFENVPRRDAEKRYVGNRKVAHVAIASVDHAMLVELILRARGYRAVSQADENAEFAVADETLRQDAYALYRDNDILMGDFAMWRLEQISSVWINVDKLNEWLTNSLIPHAAAL